MANTKLSYPEQRTWFIIYDDNKKVLSYGDIGSKQVMETKWSEVHYYADESEWANVLTQNKIDPYKEDEE